MDWLLSHSIAVTGLLAIFCVGTYIIHRKCCKKCDAKCHCNKSSKFHLNNLINKNDGIVVDRLDLSTLDKKDAVLCRCWLSKKFPYCDGTHRAHNKETGDNVGPIIVSSSSE